MITTRQREILEFLTKYNSENRMAPTRREILKKLGFASLSTVSYHLKRLAEAGFIEITAFVDRGIVVLDQDSQTKGLLTIPLLGTVSAGHPLETFSAPSEQIEVPSVMINPKFNNYGLRVRGDSMIDEHICHDDYLVVQSQLVAKNGDTVVALIDGSSTTVKTIFFERGRVRLQPANRDFDPIIIKPPQTLEVQGIVVGVLRYK